MTVIDVLLIVLIISASALCIFLIFSLRKLFKDIEAVRSDIHNLVEKANPVLDNLTEFTTKTNRIVSEAENYWDELDRSIKRLREKVSDFTSFKMFRDTETHIKEFVTNLKALTKGISAFWKSYKSY